MFADFARFLALFPPCLANRTRTRKGMKERCDALRNDAAERGKRGGWNDAPGRFFEPLNNRRVPPPPSGRVYRHRTSLPHSRPRCALLATARADRVLPCFRSVFAARTFAGQLINANHPKDCLCSRYALIAFAVALPCPSFPPSSRVPRHAQRRIDGRMERGCLFVHHAARLFDSRRIFRSVSPSYLSGS